jgi:hypothetical protein
MKHLPKVLLALLFVMLMAGCEKPQGTSSFCDLNDTVKRNSIYYWRTTFELDSAETTFLKRHNVTRMYLRMFDVATEHDFLNNALEVVPIATTKFVTPVPENVEIVPVAYITIDALRAMKGHERNFAGLLADRLCAMALYNKCGAIREIQLDCDWTKTTKGVFDFLCQSVRDTLQTRGIRLSATIRLHQLQETPPPVDRGVLMLYNTGALKQLDTKNSILHIDDVKPYLKTNQYALPLDYAYPVFGWGVKFEGDTFAGIVSEDAKPLNAKEMVRHERPAATEILNVKQLVEKHLGKPANSHILYHLDDSQLTHYTDDEISEIYHY